MVTARATVEVTMQTVRVEFAVIVVIVVTVRTIELVELVIAALLPVRIGSRVIIIVSVSFKCAEWHFPGLA